MDSIQPRQLALNERDERPPGTAPAAESGPADTPLVQFLIADRTRRQLDKRAHAALIGIAKGTYQRLLDGAAPRPQTLGKLRAYFGPALPEVVALRETRGTWAAEAAARPLASFLIQQWRQSGLPRPAFAKRIGVTDAALVRYLRGEPPRSDGLRRLRASFGAALPASEPLKGKITRGGAAEVFKCRICKQIFTSVPSESARRLPLTCSRRCSIILHEAKLVPWNALQRRVVERIEEAGQTHREFAESLGWSRTSFRSWFTRRGSAPRRRILERLAALFRIPYEQALAEAGGMSGEQRAGDHARIGDWRRAHTPRGSAAEQALLEAAHAAVRAKRLHRTAAQRARASAAARANPERTERDRAKLMAWNASPARPIVAALIVQLRADAQPDRATIHQWARDVAPALRLSAAAVLATWTPYLKRRGLWARGADGGRPPETKRYAEVRRLRAEWNAMPRATRPAGGVWVWIFAALKRAGRAPQTGDASSVERWFYQYRARSKH